MNLQFIIETAITKALFWWEKKYIRILILKNLVAHRIRNSSTSLVYALSLSFLILCVVSYSLQLQNVQLIKVKIFNEVRVSRHSGLELQELEPYLKEQEHLIEAFGYKMHKIAPWFVPGTYATAHSRFITQPVQVIGVTPYLFDTFNPEYVEAGYEDGSALSYSEQLYSLGGAHSAGIGSHLANELHVFPRMENEHSSFLLNMEIGSNLPTLFFETKAKYTIDSVLGIRMGKRKLTREIDIIVSVPNIALMLNSDETRNREPRFKHCYIKFKPGLDQKVRNSFLSGLKRYGWVESIDDNKEQISEVKHILDVIFDIIIALSMFLCLFSLVSSTSANMMEQTKEIGVLRAIGFTRFMIKRLYFYETFVLVFASSCLGIIVGTFVGWTMTVQQAEFISIPVSFFFPYTHLIATGLVSLICSFVAVYSPTTFILKRQIAEIFRIN